MNILRVPDAKLAISGAEVCKPTSCEGYVTKRGHFRKSWRVRYLVFNGADLQVSYFESRDAAHAPGTVPKGSFYVSSVEKHEYWIGVMGGKEKPFGFKLVGHAPSKGYIELDIFVESLPDVNKWLEVVQNALDAAKKLTRKGMTDSTKSMFGFGASISPQLQVKKLAATKEELLREALREIEGAKLIGREAVNEIVSQGEKLDQVENDLGHVEGDLDHADKLLRHLKSPVLHVFSNDNRQKKGAPTAATASASGGASATTSPVSGTEGQLHAKITGGGGTLNDLEMLALALSELEEQANLMNAEAARSTEQIARIEERLTSVNDRVQHQTKKATATMKAGNLF
uniref:Synaptosomal-associated protein 47 n=1 Tax=Globisporangium ultimum (strain ATCC 200006 / CBS 805.95 / DAOM BR144) TaxID=431595 RepID=K3W9U5_GLOUD